MNSEALVNLSDAIYLKGKKTMISGAASGIGKSVSRRFAESGCDLILVDIDEKGLNNTEEDLGIFNVKIQTIVADLSSKDKIDNI